MAGKPDESLLVQAVRYLDEPRMPPKEKLKDRQIEVLSRWVAMGLPWPGAKPATPAPAPEDGALPHHRRAAAVLVLPAGQGRPRPAVRDAAWPRSPVDRFILAALEAKGLPTRRAGRQAHALRRATFDLIGLPPTPAEVDAFLADDSPEAFARVVDRLLASPRYGERWGRHWLDVVRYADARDLIQLPPESDFREAWRYRDWVVEAFNRDLPYPDFLRYQIAGDLLPPTEPGGINADGLVATGMLAIADFVPGDVDKDQMIADYVNDQIDVVVIVGAVRPKDVQPPPPIAHAHVEPLAPQQSAGIQQVHAPDRVAGVHEIPPGRRSSLALVPPVLPHPPLLLLDIGLPEEAGDLVVAGPDPAEQVLDARDRVGHAQGLLDPGADLLGVVEDPLGDLLLESLDLGGPEAARVALVVQGAESIEPLVAEDAEPLPDLAGRDPQQFGDLLSGSPVIAPEHRREPLVDPPVLGVSPPIADVLPLPGSQLDRLHHSVPPPSRLQSPGFRPLSLSAIVGSTGPARLYRPPGRDAGHGHDDDRDHRRGSGLRLHRGRSLHDRVRRNPRREVGQPLRRARARSAKASANTSTASVAGSPRGSRSATITAART